MISKATTILRVALRAISMLIGCEIDFDVALLYLFSFVADKHKLKHREGRSSSEGYAEYQTAMLVQQRDNYRDSTKMLVDGVRVLVETNTRQTEKINELLAEVQKTRARQAGLQLLRDVG